jgi:hypothetical protein
MPDTTTVTMRLTPGARAGYEKVCLAQGVTLTALMEAIGCVFLESGVRELPAAQMVLDRARMIDAERRSRRGDGRERSAPT